MTETDVSAEKDPMRSNLPEHDALVLLNHRLSTMHQDMSEMKAALHKLTDTIVKLSLVEREQAHAKDGLERAFSAVGRVEDRLTSLEQASALVRTVPTIESRLRTIETSMVNASRTSQWVDKAVLAAVVLLTMFIGSKLGIA